MFQIESPAQVSQQIAPGLARAARACQAFVPPMACQLPRNGGMVSKLGTEQLLLPTNVWGRVPLAIQTALSLYYVYMQYTMYNLQC